MCLNFYETLRVSAPSFVRLSLYEMRLFHSVSTTHSFLDLKVRFCPSLAAFPCAVTEFSARILFLCSPFNICLGRSLQSLSPEASLRPCLWTRFVSDPWLHGPCTSLFWFPLLFCSACGKATGCACSEAWLVGRGGSRWAGTHRARPSGPAPLLPVPTPRPLGPGPCPQQCPGRKASTAAR